MAQQFYSAGPWGQAFAQPLFDGIFTILEQRLLAQKHLKLTLQQHDKIFPAIVFNINLQQWPNYRCEKIHVVYRLAINEFRDLVAVQLIIEKFEAV